MSRPEPRRAASTSSTQGSSSGAKGDGGKKPSSFSFASFKNSGILVSVLSVFVALVIGALLIIVTDSSVQEASGYFFARPADTLQAAFSAVSNAYGALLRGATFDPSAVNPAGQFGIFETLTQATPLILAGLSVSIAFQAGLFNIGGMGQIIAGAAGAAWVGFSLHLPAIIHLPLAIIAGLVCGALWGGIVGWLKATTGAHEVIVTIMLNYIALNLLLVLLRGPFKAPGGNQPISAPIDESAMFPKLVGDAFRLNWAFVLALLAVIFAAWLIQRSTTGLELRAIGSNPFAAKTAGMLVPRGYIIVMLIAGAMAGLAGVAQISGTERTLDNNIAGQLGFDAITVALLGRSKPWGTFFAALLFGAFKAGGQAMSVQADVSLDIVLVVQSMIVLFIAAPSLVKAIFGLEKKARKAKSTSADQAAQAGAKA